MTSLFPEIEPYETGLLKVDEKNQIYWEICGNPKGIPVLFVHGGPGGGSNPTSRRFFDPKKYKSILFDQRGCGRSLPSVMDDISDIANNNTENLIEDIEKLRKHLGIQSWVLFGGSWGSTLSLLYAQHYPEKVKALILRGIFTSRPSEVDFLFENGGKIFAPKQWLDFSNAVKVDPLCPSLIDSYNKVLFGSDKQEAIKAAIAWSTWETKMCTLYPIENVEEKAAKDIKGAMEISRIENHFFKHYSWLKQNEILDNCYKIAHIPTTIVQGRYDLVCPPTTAYELHLRLPKSKLILTVAGHSPYDNESMEALLQALNEYSQ